MSLDPNTKIRYSQDGVFGQAIYVGRRIGAHLDYTKERLASGRTLRIIQGAFNDTVEQSAGTHDYDACLDVSISGMDWWSAQRFLREAGWAAWYRFPPSFSEHLHMISLGYGSARVGVYIPGQVTDYYNHRTGLAGHYPDNSWHPENIAATVFNYGAWIKETTVTPEDMKAIREVIRADGDKTRSVVKAGNLAERERAVRERERDAVRAANLRTLIDALPDNEFTKQKVIAAMDEWANEQPPTEEL